MHVLSYDEQVLTCVLSDILVRLGEALVSLSTVILKCCQAKLEVLFCCLFVCLLITFPIHCSLSLPAFLWLAIRADFSFLIFVI